MTGTNLSSMIPTGKTGIVLATALALAASALVVRSKTRQAEADNPPTGNFLDIDGVRLHYVERGSGDPIVLLHGNGSMIQDFALSGVIDSLAQQYRVIAFDRPGFGHTTRPKSRVWDQEAQADLVHKALQRLNIH